MTTAPEGVLTPTYAIGGGAPLLSLSNNASKCPRTGSLSLFVLLSVYNFTKIFQKRQAGGVTSWREHTCEVSV